MFWEIHPPTSDWVRVRRRSWWSSVRSAIYGGIINACVCIHLNSAYCILINCAGFMLKLSWVNWCHYLEVYYCMRHTVSRSTTWTRSPTRTRRLLCNPSLGRRSQQESNASPEWWFIVWAMLLCRKFKIPPILHFQFGWYDMAQNVRYVAREHKILWAIPAGDGWGALHQYCCNNYSIWQADEVRAQPFHLSAVRKCNSTTILEQTFQPCIAHHSYPMSLWMSKYSAFAFEAWCSYSGIIKVQDLLGAIKLAKLAKLHPFWERGSWNLRISRIPGGNWPKRPQLTKFSRDFCLSISLKWTLSRCPRGEGEPIFTLCWLFIGRMMWFCCSFVSMPWANLILWCLRSLQVISLTLRMTYL